MITVEGEEGAHDHWRGRRGHMITMEGRRGHMFT